MITQVSGCLYTGYAAKDKCRKNQGVSQNEPQVRYNGLYNTQNSEQEKKNFPTRASTILCSMLFMLGFLLLTGVFNKAK